MSANTPYEAIVPVGHTASVICNENSRTRRIFDLRSTKKNRNWTANMRRSSDRTSGLAEDTELGTILRHGAPTYRIWMSRRRRERNFYRFGPSDPEIEYTVTGMAVQRRQLDKGKCAPSRGSRRAPLVHSQELKAPKLTYNCTPTSSEQPGSAGVFNPDPDPDPRLYPTRQYGCGSPAHRPTVCGSPETLATLTLFVPADDPRAIARGPGYLREQEPRPNQVQKEAPATPSSPQNPPIASLDVRTRRRGGSSSLLKPVVVIQRRRSSVEEAYAFALLDERAEREKEGGLVPRAYAGLDIVEVAPSRRRAHQNTPEQIQGRGGRRTAKHAIQSRGPRRGEKRKAPEEVLGLTSTTTTSCCGGKRQEMAIRLPDRYPAIAGILGQLGDRGNCSATSFLNDVGLV
ncbi:hypothetical protein BDZ89DRAFT_1111194 [Hymenopellis radicata]|nr:hypothetical protein BDZ89DRAFT_1111194 [Hymenopellis radicata]